MNESNGSNLIDRLTMMRLIDRYKSGDYLVLDDATLRAALDNSRPLLRTEWQALLDSPLTLRRARELAHEAKARHAGRALAPAANDEAFERSTTLLRVAYGLDPAPTLTSDDGRWRLSFGRDGPRWHVVLSLNPSDRFADVWLQARPTVALLDGAGATLLLGELDEDGEVEGPWRPDSDPLAYLASHGGRWQVVRA